MTPPPSPKKATKPRTSKRAAEPNVTAPRLPVTLVVGTDTAVGKTWITCALATALKAAGQQVIAVKPFETGCGLTPGVPEDGELLAQATGQAEPRQALVRLKSPLAVAVAADQEGVTIDYEVVLSKVREYARPDVFLLVEGVGGLLAPVTWSDNALDMAHSLNARMLVVSSDRLGTINHTLLTLRVLKAEKLPILGVVLNQPAEPDESSPSNAGAISRLANTDSVVRVPHMDDPDLAAEAVKEVAGWLLP
jgi:dethiobiotin synthetase